MRPRPILREEFVGALLDLGSTALELADYQTTGLRAVCVGPSGVGKTNAGLLFAEQLAAQGWVSVLMDPEGDLSTLGFEIMANAEQLESHLRGRHHPLLVVRVRDTHDFLHYGRVIERVVDEERRPVFLMVDEGQIFSTSRRSKGMQGEATDLMNAFTERGRKRALDLFITAHGFSGTLSRSVFRNKNITLIGRQEDPTAWSSLAPQFKGSGIGFSQLAGLAPGEFICFSRRGAEKITMALAEALKPVAKPATRVRPTAPSTFAEWDRAMAPITPARLEALTDPVVSLLSTLAGLSPAQIAAGTRALRDEREASI